MSLEQTLNKLRGIINETLPELELFVDGNVQPSSNDCENLQKHLNGLQEQLSVFKYLKTNKEISPSFGIHSKVSEASIQSNPTIESAPKNEPVIVESKIVEPIETKIVETVSETKKTGSKKLEISLNQKFQFINELFMQNATEYNSAIDQLNQTENWADAESYLYSLKSVYNWKDDNETHKRLKELSKKRFE